MPAEELLEAGLLELELGCEEGLDGVEGLELGLALGLELELGGLLGGDDEDEEDGDLHPLMISIRDVSRKIVQ